MYRALFSALFTSGMHYYNLIYQRRIEIESITNVSPSFSSRVLVELFAHLSWDSCLMDYHLMLIDSLNTLDNEVAGETSRMDKISRV